ncbi:MAG TPA: helix-turn-helix transcriptional regulator [Acidimicrobiales bacterium]
MGMEEMIDLVAATPAKFTGPIDLVPPGGLHALADVTGAALSPREAQVVALIAAGLTNREIAEHAGISVKTVDTHRGHALKKIGARNNADLTRWAITYGLANLEGYVTKASFEVEDGRRRGKYRDLERGDAAP